MMTGYASKETAVEAMRLGAFDYIEKPCKLVEIEAILLKIVERRKLKHKNIALQTRIQAAEGPNRLIGESAAMQTVQRLIATIVTSLYPSSHKVMHKTDLLPEGVTTISETREGRRLPVRR